MRTSCSVCGKELWRRRWFLQHTELRVCGHACKHALQKTGKEVSCTLCGKLLYRSPAQLAASTSGNYFCNASCRAKHYNTLRVGEKHPNFKHGATTFRTLLRRKHGGRCSNPKCPLTRAGIQIPPFLLEAHHIDSDPTNNAVCNGEQLCTWCHRHITITGNLPT